MNFNPEDTTISIVHECLRPARFGRFAIYLNGDLLAIFDDRLNAVSQFVLFLSENGFPVEQLLLPEDLEIFPDRLDEIVPKPDFYISFDKVDSENYVFLSKTASPDVEADSMWLSLAEAVKLRDELVIALGISGTWVQAQPDLQAVVKSHDQTHKRQSHSEM